MEDNHKEISDESLAAFLDGNVSMQEANDILSSIAGDKDMQELLRISAAVDSELARSAFTILPMAELAAENEDKQCSFDLESFILHREDYDIDKWTLLQEAKANNWLREQGTPLHHVGRLLELKGMYVKRKYETTLDELERKADEWPYVIVVVDKNKLPKQNKIDEEVRYHAIMITWVDSKDDDIEYLDLETLRDVCLTVDEFTSAWNCSNNYMVLAANSVHAYNPEPINLDDVDIEDELLDLQEAIAENAHDVWARARMDEGWSYGPKRDDNQKKNPDLVPYAKLLDSEKEYDRKMALNTIRLVKKLGYDLVKRK